MISSLPFSAKDFACPCARCRQLKVQPVAVDPRLIEWANTIRTSLNGANITSMITSGVRCAEHNAEVGGAPQSRHLTGKACDMLTPSSEAAWRMVYTLMSRTLCHFIEVAPKHIHFDTRDLGHGVGPKLITGKG